MKHHSQTSVTDGLAEAKYFDMSVCQRRQSIGKMSAVFSEGFGCVNLGIPLCCRSRKCLRRVSKFFVRAVIPSELARLIAVWLSAYLVVGIYGGSDSA